MYAYPGRTLYCRFAARPETNPSLPYRQQLPAAEQRTPNGCACNGTAKSTARCLPPPTLVYVLLQLVNFHVALPPLAAWSHQHHPLMLLQIEGLQKVAHVTAPRNQ